MRKISKQRIYLHCPLRKWSIEELIETQLSNKVLLFSVSKVHACTYRKTRSSATDLLLLVIIFIPLAVSTLTAGLAVSHVHYSTIAFFMFTCCLFCSRDNEYCHFPYPVEMGPQESWNTHADRGETSGAPGNTGRPFISHFSEHCLLHANLVSMLRLCH